MPIFFKKIQKRNPSEKTAPELWRLILKNTGLVKEKVAYKLLVAKKTLNPEEAEPAMAQLLKVVGNLMFESHNVQFADLRTFRLTSGTAGVEPEKNAKN
ncbi:MAG: hypothetical protein LBT50_03370 [Prevotellaceae bacterium]|jgi:hypothetical protein|nr:hypothetical protein [Prevotellaceae bacterium]